MRHAPTQFFELYNKTIQDDYDARFGKTDTNDKDLVDDAQLFGESFTGDIFGELKAYYETGMQMLNFPLFFTLDGMLSSGSNGGGDLGQLSYPQGGDTGALNEFGGLGAPGGRVFVQSHDSPPPSGQANLAYAFIMTRVGDPVVFYDGNNPDPASFVQPGRPDALGELGSRVIKDLVWVHNHFARGGMWNRFVDDDAYVYERVVPNQRRHAAGDPARQHRRRRPRRRRTAWPLRRERSASAPGHRLPAGHASSSSSPGRRACPPSSPSSIPTPSPPTPATARSPSSIARATPACRPAMASWPPRSLGPGARLRALRPAGPRGRRRARAPSRSCRPASASSDLTLTTVGEKRTATGARVAPVHLTVARITGNTVTLQTRTDATAQQVFLSLDGGRIRLGNRDVVTGTPEGAFDGSVEMASTGTATDGDKLWEVPGIDMTGLAEGVHVLRARAMRGGRTTCPLEHVRRAHRRRPRRRRRSRSRAARSRRRRRGHLRGQLPRRRERRPGRLRRGSPSAIPVTCARSPAPRPCSTPTAAALSTRRRSQEILAVVDEVFERRASIVDVVRKIDEVNP